MLKKYIQNDTQILVISGELTDLNTYMNIERTNRYAAASEKKNNVKKVLWAINISRIKSVDYPVWLSFRFYCKNKRKDKDNIASYARKVIQDALVEGSVLPNDGWDNIEGYTDSFYIDKANPRIEVEIGRGKVC